MNTPDQVRPKRRMYSPVPRHSVFTFEKSAAQSDIKVAFTGFGRACMARVTGAVINNTDLARVKGRAQLVFNFLPDRHFFSSPPSILAAKA